VHEAQTDNTDDKQSPSRQFPELRVGCIGPTVSLLRQEENSDTLPN
jgi:hypothetical protein